MRVRIQAYGPSKSSLILARESGIKRLRLAHTKFRARPEDLIINWGSRSRLFDCNYWNDPEAVRVSQSKYSSLRAMDKGEVCVPPFTKDKETAQDWQNNGYSVVARTLDRASAGRGIVFCAPGCVLPNARLYTRYVPKFDEYRVHVWGGEVVDVQQKRRRSGVQYCNRIRTSTKGWVFCREDVEAPEAVRSMAVRACTVLGLDFGAVDIGYTRSTERATVYEVNTAPGLEGSTLQTYAGKLRQVASS